MIFIVTVTIFLATALVTLALFWWMEGRKESLVRRFREAASPPEETSGSIFGNARKRFGERWKRLTSKSPRHEELVAMFTGEELRGARLLLNQAGYRAPAAYRIYSWTRVGLPVLLAGFAFAYGRAGGLTNQSIVIAVLAGSVAGFILPDLFVRRKIRKRQEEITDSLPDALDLLVVCIEAGMGINAAFVKITEEFKLSSPVLSEEFDIVNREMVAGKPRQEALRALADRAGVEDVQSLVAMLIQTEKLGTSLSQSLRVHSDSLRTRRRQRAEEAAAKTTIKLVFPLVFLLFPALFIVILGPGVIQIIKILLPVAQK